MKEQGQIFEVSSLAIWRVHARAAELHARTARRYRAFSLCDLTPARVNVTAYAIHHASRAADHARIAAAARDGFQPITHRGQLRA